MIELKSDQLVFTFPEVHPQAKLSISFQRTLRIPDDDNTYPLPPGLGEFPLRHVDDFAESVSAQWLKRGGVMLPMYQSEAMWLNFDSEFVDGHDAAYPFAIKIAAGKQCAVSGQAWQNGLRRESQDYLVVPEQPWLDGFVVEKGLIRQFVAMPLGSGYSAEEQITGNAEYGGLQIAVCPMKRDVFERRFPKRREVGRSRSIIMSELHCKVAPDMGLAPGGMMRQEVYDDPYDFTDWQTAVSSRCFVHLCNSMVWQSITNSPPPHPAPTAKSYSQAGLPWFEYYDDSKSALNGSGVLAQLQSIAQKSAAKGEVVLPENATATPEKIVEYRTGLRQGQVREGNF
ncbi:hypothetical protein LOC68_05420 [Blastopirellula sp. JC732]|uniref:Integral membrane protein n=1 Tax=Blastopirellula sediminis TaxID=2894196 RepID=A0A9X1MK85_9BACT|nr:hypothetical protein [Blastopirellula sediminis]MCC9609396.1 hypothetical protein [Blastopirellula sediminis]MCC9627827.1 hypothetical protein [Blastopirellula sediminis]